MISRFDYEPFDLTDEVIVKTVLDINADELEKDIPVYVPLIMCDIQQGEPESSQLKTNGRTVFVNATDCKPAVSPTLKQKNFIIGKLEYDSSINRFITEKDGRRILPSGTKFRGQFVLGNLSHLSLIATVEL